MKLVARIIVAVALLLGVIAVFGQGSSSAQIPDKFENLKVLPKDISKAELVSIMRSFSFALGVRCGECHASVMADTGRTDQHDFASDEKADKETARHMMRMVRSINEQIGAIGIEAPVKVECVTCHHGVKKPETLGAAMNRAMAKGGVEAGIERYRSLRSDYYGSAAYDFSPGTLVEIAGAHADAQKDPDGALKLLELSLEFHPQHVNTHITMGRVYAAKGDTAAAIASFQKALQIAPDNGWAKQQIERVRSGK